MKAETLESCLCKSIAENDLRKPDELKTLDPMKKCYECKGNDYECRTYLKMEVGE